MTTRCRITTILSITDTRTHQSSTQNSHCKHEPTHLAERPSQYSILFHPVHPTPNHSILASFKLAGDLDSPRFLPSFMNSTRQIQHCGNTGTHSHNRSLAQNSNTNISGFQCNRIVCPHFNNPPLLSLDFLQLGRNPVWLQSHSIRSNSQSTVPILLQRATAPHMYPGMGNSTDKSAQ